MFYSEIIGTGGYAPDRIVKNTELENIVETSDQWIRTRTGISERRISTGETNTQIAVKAAQRAIKNANINSQEIDLVILATITPDYFTPATACLVQAELGLKKITSFDLSAGCTGFIYGVQIADQFIKTGQSSCALVIGSEVLSKTLNWNDRNTCVLFGDGAGAVVQKKSKSPGIVSTYTSSQGDLKGYLNIPAIPLSNPFLPGEYMEVDYLNSSKMYMDGKEIFKFATNIMIESIVTILEKNNLQIKDIDYVVPHQANYRIINYVAKKLKVPCTKFYKNLQYYGNTSAASIPLVLDEMRRKNILEKDNKIVMVGFGGGLTWGSILLNWTI